MAHAESEEDGGGLVVRSRRGRWVLASTVLGSGMAAIDATVVSIALPTIGREFHAPVSTLQWVVTGYSLTLSALLLTGGTLGDRYGRRRMFAVGVVWFTVASAACALAPGAGALVFLRFLQGIGGALLTPGSLALLQAAFRPDERSGAIGAWTGLGGVANAAGPLVGGYLVSALGWRWIFLINLPLGVVVLLSALRHVPESRDGSPHSSLDVAGSLLAVVALTGVTYGLIEGPSTGWGRPAVAGALLLGAAAAVAFSVTERRAADPTLPLELFGNRQFSVTNAVTFVVYAALGGVLFLLPVELQVVGHYSPLASGVALLPLTLIMLGFSSASGRLAARIGPRLQMSTGPVVVGLGVALLARAGRDTYYWSGVLPAVLVFGTGLAITVAPLTATALAAAPGEHAGVASAVNNVVARVGGLLAVAVLPALAGISGTAYLRPEALASGFRTVTLSAGLLCLVGGALALVGIRNGPVTPGPTPGGKAAPVTRVHCALDAPPLDDEQA